MWIGRIQILNNKKTDNEPNMFCIIDYKQGFYEEKIYGYEFELWFCVVRVMVMSGYEFCNL